MFEIVPSSKVHVVIHLIFYRRIKFKKIKKSKKKNQIEQESITVGQKFAVKHNDSTLDGDYIIYNGFKIRFHLLFLSSRLIYNLFIFYFRFHITTLLPYFSSSRPREGKISNFQVLNIKCLIFSVLHLLVIPDTQKMAVVIYTSRLIQCLSVAFNL